MHPHHEGSVSFSYPGMDGGTVFIRRLGRVVARLRHSAARDFLAEAEGASPANAEETMARTTGTTSAATNAGPPSIRATRAHGGA